MQARLLPDALEERSALLTDVAVHHHPPHGRRVEFAVEHCRQIHLDLQAWVVAALEEGHRTRALGERVGNWEAEASRRLVITGPSVARLRADSPESGHAPRI